MKDNTKQAYINIDFVKRYQRFSSKYTGNRQGEIGINKYSIEKINDIMKNIFHNKIIYDKQGFWFYFYENDGIFTFGFGAKFRYSYVDIGTSVKKKGTPLEIGGPWAGIYRDLIGKMPEDPKEPPYPRPNFTSYAELEEILREAYATYTDFKKELLRLEAET